MSSLLASLPTMPCDLCTSITKIVGYICDVASYFVAHTSDVALSRNIKIALLIFLEKFLSFILS